MPVFPHIKLTREAYPRALATRILNDDGDEYFGAFLNRTSVRILIDFLNRTFRLRTCTIPIDGSFPVPCTQYYARRCVAPCVANLTDRETYLEIVQLVRLFLRNDRELLHATISKKIERAAEKLDFETAALFRDRLHQVESFWSQARWQIWLEDSTDLVELDVHADVVYVILISQRRRRILGEKVYAFPNSEDADVSPALYSVIDEFYRYHLPREIRVSHDFAGRLSLAKALGKRFGRSIAINIATDANRRITAQRVVDVTKARLVTDRTKGKLTVAGLQNQLMAMFDLKARPARIEAFDAAHISATGFAAAVSVWKDGKDLPAEYEHWVSDRESELDTLRAFVAARIARTRPDLILIDGGAAQLRAANDAVANAGSKVSVITAVKPKGQHGSISHFLTEDGRRVEYDRDIPASRLLHRMRDDAHDLANRTHRLGRDMLHFYELAAILPSLDERERQDLMREFGSIRSITTQDAGEFEKRFGKKKAAAIARDLAAARNISADAKPLIVPIRYVETDGEAEDLIPIDTR